MKAALLVVLALQQAPYDLAPRPELRPGTTYDPAVPTLEEVVGHDIREEITSPAGIVRYMEALAEAAPDRARLIRYGTTWEGRELVMLVLGSPERIGRLEAVKADLRRLADPRGLSGAEAERLVAELPVVSAMVHGVHGNEISSSGAAMAQAYHLLAAENDPAADLILRESLVVIDPNQNPDGRARFLHQNLLGRARWPDPDPASAEHDEPWPGGRVNHYLFDLNRDWFRQSQPESRGRVAALLEFMPHVVADLHEMGGNSTYYFPPNAVPGNPWTTAAQTELLELVGRNNGRAFDRRGFPYFIAEVYDAFYPGYGVSWPMAQGALGMTFEQASARGLVYRRSDGTLLTYGDGVLHHFTAAMTTLETAARNRERILREFLAFRRSAVDLGGDRSYVLHSAHDPAMAAELARTLARNGIEVVRPSGAVRVGGRQLAADRTYVVPLAQPAHRLLRNLLDPTTEMNPEFVAEQRERRARRLRDQIYDVTAWSLPLLWDVERIEARGLEVEGERVTVEGAAGSGRMPAAGIALAGGNPGAVAGRDRIVAAAGDQLAGGEVGWLVPWTSAGAAAVAGLLREGLLVQAVGGSFALGDASGAAREFPLGTVVVRRSSNPGTDLDAVVARVVRETGAEVVPLGTTYPETGVSPGGRTIRALRLPSVLLAWDEPAGTYSAGWARYVLERRYGVPVSAVRGSTLGRIDLSDYDVVVLPSGGYGSLGDGSVERLRDWMRAGGTLVTMAESSRWAAEAGLLESTPELRGGRPAVGEGRPAPRSEVPEQPIDLLEAIAPPLEAPEQTPGAILNVDLRDDHWLTAGTDGRIGVLVEGSRIFTPVTLDQGTNVGVYAPMGELVAGGIVWEAARPQLAQKAFLVHQPEGRGQLVAFAEDPNYRAYAEASQLLFVNAVLLGPGR